MKYYYIVVTHQRGEKRGSTVVRVSEFDNLLCRLNYQYAIDATIMPTKKEAERVATEWNEHWIAEGRYLWDFNH